MHKFNDAPTQVDRLVVVMSIHSLASLVQHEPIDSDQCRPSPLSCILEDSAIFYVATCLVGLEMPLVIHSSIYHFPFAFDFLLKRDLLGAYSHFADRQDNWLVV